MGGVRWPYRHWTASCQSAAWPTQANIGDVLPATPAIPASPPVTFSLEDLQRLVAEGVAQAMAQQRAEFEAAMAVKPQPASGGKPDISAANDLECIRVFKRAGFKDLQPRLNILTFRKWSEHGYRPREGSKALKVKNLRLWHVSQVRKLTAEELQKLKEQSAVPVRRHNAKVIPISGEANPQ